MKKTFLTILVSICMICFAGNANALVLSLNPDVAFGTSNGPTDVFEKLGVLVETKSLDFGNGTFTDSGTLQVDALKKIVGPNTAGLNSSWWMVGYWSNLAGTYSIVNPPVGNIREYDYDSGFMTLAVTQTFIGSTWDWSTTFANTIPVASLSLRDGYGLLNTSLETGTVISDWEFTSLLDGFWLDGNGNWLTALDDDQNPFLLAFGDINTDDVTVVDNNTYDNDGNIIGTPVPVEIYSDHDGTVTIGVVPEPASMLLFGSGLFGLVGAGIKKRKLA